MSDTTRLNIGITATDGASASIRQLQATVAALNAQLAKTAQVSQSASSTMSAAAQRTIATLQAEIAAVNQLIAAQEAASGRGVAAAQREAEAINRNMDLIARQAQAQIRASNARVYAEREATDAAARFEAEQINASMAAREAQVRRQIALNNSRVYAEQNAEDTAMRARADRENAEFDRRKRLQEEPARIIASKGPSAAAAQAAAAATLGGATAVEAEAAAVKAATAALEKQAMAARAVAAAMTAAGAAGASAEEVQVAAIGAATMAMREQASVGETVASGGGVARLGALLQRETRHVFGFFDSIARGQRGAAFSSLGAAARDAGAGIGFMGASMGALVAVMGTEAILHHAEALGKWATEAKAAAAATGMSVHSYTELQGALRIAGLSATEADASLRHFAISLATAIANPASDAAQAFRNLKITQEELIKTGGDVNAGIELMAAAWRRVADDANAATNREELFGKGVERIAPLLVSGKEGLDAFRQKANDLSLTLTGVTADALEQTGEKARLLGLKISGEVTKAFIEAGPVIEGFIGILGSLASVLGGIIGLLGRLQSAMDSIHIPAGLQNILMFGPGAGAAINAFQAIRKGIDLVSGGGAAPAAPVSSMTSEDVMRLNLRRTQQAGAFTRGGDETITGKIDENVKAAGEKAMQAAYDAHQKLKAINEAGTRAEISELQKSLAAEGLTDKEKGRLRAELLQKQMSLIREEAAGGAGKANRQDANDFIAAEKLKIAEANGNSQKIAQIYDEEIAHLQQLAAAHKATAAMISNAEREKVNAVNAAKLEEIKAGAQQEQQQARLFQLNTQLAQMAAGTFQYSGQKETPGAEQRQSQQYLQEAAQVQQMAQQEIAALTQVANTAEQGSKTQVAAQNEIMSVLLSSKQQEVELYKKAGDAAVAAANKSSAAMNKMFDSIGSAFETFGQSLVDALVNPQKEIIKAGLSSKTINEQGSQIRAAIGSLFTSIAGDIGKELMKSLSHGIASALSGGTAGSIGDLLGGWLKKGFSSIFGGATGDVAGKAVSGAAGSALTGGAGATALTTAGTTLTTAGAGLTTAGAALNTAAAALSTAGATSSVGGAAGGVAGSAVGSTEVTTAITASSAAIVGAITTGDATIVTALTALTLKPSVAGFSFASGGIVPSAQGGMMVGGTGGTLAVLHAREMVLPEPISRGLQQMIARGGIGGNTGTSNTANLNFSPTINTAPRSRGGTGMTRGEFTQVMSLHSGAMLGEARNMMRSGWRPS